MEGLDIFTKKCPYPKQEDSDDEEPCCHKKYQKTKIIYKKKFQKNKKNIHSKEDSEDVEVLFMGFKSENHGEEI